MKFDIKVSINQSLSTIQILKSLLSEWTLEIPFLSLGFCYMQYALYAHWNSLISIPLTKQQSAGFRFHFSLLSKFLLHKTQLNTYLHT